MSAALHSRTRYGGFSLTELFLGTLVFFAFLGLALSFLTRGYQAFHFLQTRQSLQGEALRLKTVLEADFGRTHFRSIGVQPHSITVDGETLDRHLANCVSLDHWGDPDNYRDMTGIPIWNRNVIYRSSGEELGRLERLAVGPSDPGPLRAHPLREMETPEGPILGRQVLTANLRSFRVEPDVYLQEVVISLELKGLGSRRGLDQHKADELFRAEFHWTPNNTVPRF